MLALGKSARGRGLAEEESQVKGPGGSSSENGRWGKKRGKGTRRKREMQELGREKIMGREREKKSRKETIEKCFSWEKQSG